MAVDQGFIIVITGPLGAGKTTVAQISADTFDTSVLLHGDDFFHCIHRGYISPWLPTSDRQSEVVIDATAAAAVAYARGGYAVIVDGIIGPWFLERWLHHVPAELPMHYILLMPSEAVALQRAAQRSDTTALVHPDPVSVRHHAFAERNDHDHYVLDSSNLTAEQTASSVLSLVSAGRLLVRRHLLASSDAGDLVGGQ